MIYFEKISLVSKEETTEKYKDKIGSRKAESSNE